ncbi:MAG: VWA domain-containing protein [Isosphaeraceae bacterium]|nr:VWA domain-containing protein [Isosphaeraceae bacterium]
MAFYEYTKWDGSQQFSPQSAEEAFDNLADYIMRYGDQVMRNLDDFADDDTKELLEIIEQQGLIEKDENGRYAVTPKGLRRIQESALTHLFQTFNRDGVGRHETERKGDGSIRHEDVKPYTYGDPLSNLNLHETLRNAMNRQGGGVPIRVRQDDFVVHETEYSAKCATVLLIDMSGSMARYGKYATTKKVALALQAMVRGRYPGDTIEMVGFYSYANRMNEKELLNSAPKPVSIFDSRVHLRFDLDNLPKKVPQHFTNIDAGLKLARSILTRSAAANKQIICITDGEPTAHLEGRSLLLIYPPSEKTARATLEEARRCAAAGIRVSSFALIEDYFYLGLVNFVEEMAKATKGVAAYCNAEELGKYVLDSFVDGRRVRRMHG